MHPVLFVPCVHCYPVLHIVSLHSSFVLTQPLFECSTGFPNVSPRDNLSGRLHKAIRDLKRDKDIIILPADKGNATVVMDQSDYTAKMDDLLGDPAYKKLKRNPTTKVEAQISAALKELEQKGCLVRGKVRGRCLQHLAS